MVITKHKQLGELIHAFLVEHAGGEKKSSPEHPADGGENR